MKFGEDPLLSPHITKDLIFDNVEAGAVTSDLA